MTSRSGLSMQNVSPDTASSPEPVDGKHQHKKKKKRRRRRRHKNVFDIEGVRKMVLSELTQKIIGCVAGENVTSENSWIWIDKEVVQDNLELHEESSEFLPIKKFILEYPRTQILIGYIPDETKDYEEFYICVTEAAADAVTGIIERMKQEQEERLQNSINKDIHHWTSLGTEIELEETMLKNNRPLLEVEVETKYPIFPNKIQFRLVNAEQRKDGYMELTCGDDVSFENIHMRRIDSCIQVTPGAINRDAQTTCTYPINSSTQYHYEVEDTSEWFKLHNQEIVAYANENFEDLSDLLRVNGHIDLYTNDFAKLDTESKQVSSLPNLGGEFQEYMSLMDVNLCKDKMVSDICWHRMWSGTVAICYADAAPNTFMYGVNKEDEVHRAVYGINPLLIWSFLDGLKPKLILQSPREVHTVSFCKFDENILVGGCKNGQIVIWDIRRKLDKVEEVEILTSAQQKYRNYMFSLMDWMKDTTDLCIIPATAVSNIKYSHKGPVTDISWLDPNYEISKSGNLIELEDEDERSMQLLTSSEDGTVLVWDLKKTPTITSGGYKPRRLKRLQKKPSALEMDISPYRILNYNLKPIYKINVLKPNTKKYLPISKFCTNYCHIFYEEVNPEKNKNKKFNMSERIMLSPLVGEKKPDIGQEFIIGTSEGDVAKIKWDGQDFDSGEIVNSESCQYISLSKYHDGPVLSASTSMSCQCTLTIGGKVLALWHDDFPGRPVLWRSYKHMFTRGEWNFYAPYKFIVYSVDGVYHKWILPLNSKEPMSSNFMSSTYTTASGLHPVKRKVNIYGIGDKQGVFRLFYATRALTEPNMNTLVLMNTFIAREIKRKQNFLKWQEEWNKRHEVVLKQKQIIEDEEEAEKAEETKEEEIEKEDEKEKAAKKGPQPGKFIEWLIEQRKLNEEARVKSIIISKKQLDTKELERQRKPLQQLEEENQRKKMKQKQKLKEGEHIFHETVATLFPEVVKEKPQPPPDPYAGGDSLEELGSCFFEYEELQQDSDDFIELNPFQQEFDWKQVIMSGRTRRQGLVDIQLPHDHRNRRLREKQGYVSETNIDRDEGETEEKTVDDNQLDDDSDLVMGETNEEDME